ncbi:hypothetical protein PUF88_05410 [Lactobacillaceae bacterium L1_55_11]|nr:hypothetical protein [Lactobacillaceae bacterium L1_55_11]
MKKIFYLVVYYWLAFLGGVGLVTVFFVLFPESISRHPTPVMAPAAGFIFLNNAVVLLTMVGLGYFWHRLGQGVYWFNLIRFLLLYAVSLSINGIPLILGRLMLFGPLEVLAMAIGVAIISDQQRPFTRTQWVLLVLALVLLAVAAIIEEGVLK